MTDPADLSATEAAKHLAGGRLTAAALMEACLDRIARRDPQLHAFVHCDPAPAMAQAAAADRRPPRGPLHGLPLAVKDVLDTADMPTGYGSPIWSGFRPRADAVAVAQARSAGALVIGKTVTTEFATRKPGPTVNPHHSGHTPGGSSSGSAAAVAAGFCPLAYGTQTAGSIIRPAAFCGIVGYKPSFGFIHRAGMKVMSETLDTIGVLARSVADCALMMSAVTGRDLGDPDEAPGTSPRLALVIGPSDAAAPETVARLLEIAGLLRRAGAQVDEPALPQEAIAAFAVHGTVMNMEIAQALGWELATAPDGLSELLHETIGWARTQPATVLDEGREVFLRARRAFAAWMAGYDAVITPSAIGEAPEGLGNTGNPVFNTLWSALNAPCVTVPAGPGPRGLPLGLQVVGVEGRDRATLAWARWIEARL
jgi:amidase